MRRSIENSRSRRLRSSIELRRSWDGMVLPQRLRAGAQEVELFLDSRDVRRHLRVDAFQPRAERRPLVGSELDVSVLGLLLPDRHRVPIELLAPLEQL